MVVNDDTMKHIVSDGRRHATIVGIFVVVGLALILLHNSVTNHGVQFSIISSAQTSSKSEQQMISSNDSCSNCHNDREFLLANNMQFAEFELERQQCLDDIRSRIMNDYRPFFENVSKIALVDVALHFNLGDSILWRAALHLTTMFGHPVHYVCAGVQHYHEYATFRRCDTEKLIEIIKDNGLAMYHAGGNWGNLYRYVQKYRLKVFKRLGEVYEAENATFKVIQLPQSIAYTPDEVRAINEDDAIINSLPPGMFTLFTRQDDSFEWAHKHYKNNINIFASPDMAFALGQLRPIGKPVIDVAFIMRDDEEDKEKSQNLKARVAKRFEGTELTYSFQDWGYSDSTDYSKDHPTLISEIRLNGAIRIISRGKVLITNRFHAHVLGMMIGKTTFWTDTIQEKLKHSRAVAFNSSIHCTEKSMRSFGFKSTMDAVDAAIAHLSDHTSSQL